MASNERPYRTIYSSKATRRIGVRALQAIVAPARDYNTSVGVTGLLLYSRGSFLQLLDGPTDAVHGVMGRVRRASEHRDVRTIFAGYADAPMFPDWSMGVSVLGLWWPPSLRPLAHRLFVPDAPAALALFESRRTMALPG